MSEPLLSVKNMKKTFQANGGMFSKKKFVHAVNDVSFDIYPGETFSLVGESGCGKSTTGKLIDHLITPDSGEIWFEGKEISRLSEKEMRPLRSDIQMVFQDPLASFDPKMKIVDILTEPLINFGKLKKSEKEAKARELLEMVELPGDFADRYPHNMSGGQRQRVAIARALALEPEILILDEATSALDVSVQQTIIELIVKLQKEKNITIGFICHDISLIQSCAHEVAVMYLGNVVEVLPAEDLAEHAVHPYTRALIGSVFDIGMDFSKPIEEIKGEAPSPLDVPAGCPFRGRCPKAIEQCGAEKPKLQQIGADHEVACHLFDKEDK